MSHPTKPSILHERLERLPASERIHDPAVSAALRDVGITPKADADAMNRLVAAGAQFVEQALRDNPDGPVSMWTTLTRTEIDYEVTVGFMDDRSRGRIIWHKTVVFGHTDRTVAGGAAFVEAARVQETVAWSALALMESLR